MKIQNCESDDISNLLHMSLLNLGYSKKKITQYVLLIEEALAKWKSDLNPESELCFTREDTKEDAVFVFSVKERKLNPFSRETVAEYDKPIRTMYDKLLIGVGTELKFRYRHGVNEIVLRLPKHNIMDTLFNRTAISFLITFALQIIVQNIASNIDILMLGFKSSSAMSGVSFASQLVLIHTLIFMALTGAVSSLFSQLYGQRKSSSVLYALKLAVIVVFLFNTVEFFACFLFPEKLMGLYTDIPELISEGSRYLKIVSFSFLLEAFYVVFYAFLRVIDKRSVVTKLLVAGCVVNVVLNALLIFGLSGIPSLGVTGAAIATVAASLVQFVLSVVYYFRNRKLFFFDTDNKAVDKKNICRAYFKNAAPTLAQHIVYLVGLNFMTAAVGRLNADIIAAYSFINTINSYIFSIKDGCGQVTTILTGIELGKNNFEGAKHNGALMKKLGVKLGLLNIFALFVLVFLLQILPFKLSDASKLYLLPLTIITSINAFFGYMNNINNGMLYVGGEARFISIVDAVYALCISLPISLIAINTGFFAPMVLLILSKIDEIITSFPKKLGVDNGKWLRNIV